MDKRTFLKRLDKAYARVRREITANAAAGHIGGGLSSEGYAGGYSQALMDVDALLRHGYPADPRHYWDDE